MNPWHSIELPKILTDLSVSESGLTSSAAQKRQLEYGPNRLPRAEPPSIFEIAVNQFRNPLIYILALAGVVSLAINEPVDAGFIFGILVLNGLIGGFQEWRAEQSSHALQGLLRTRATVVRDGEAAEVDAELLVPGDIVWLESGNRVPADIRLLSEHALEVDEALLTGESLPASKDARWIGAEETSVGDRLNMTYAGSIVARGRAKGVVVATGSSTVVGQLAREVSGAPAGRPPLLVRMERFTRVIGVAVLSAAVLVGIIGVMLRDYSVTDMFLFAVALAVSAIPEGLPVSLTVVLSVATTRMARRHVIVRRLAAVEGLGSCTVIASDKTGTLTCNELTVRAITASDGSRLEVSGEGYQPAGEILEGEHILQDQDLKNQVDRLAQVAVLCNEASLYQVNGAWQWRGDPTDVALLAMGYKSGTRRETVLDRFPQVNEIPFEPERKYSATFHRSGESGYACVKGAPERILEMCTGESEQRRAELAAQARQMAQEGYRVLAFADGFTSHTEDPEDTPAEPTGLTFVGFVGMIDPLRPGVRDAITACRDAGIRVIMVTGDHPVTALAISRNLNLAFSPEEVVSGTDLLDMSDEELERMITRVRVFARVAPQQKLAIVKAARRMGEFVAVTGDGVNDAPALRSANIGVAMGKSGTDVAREVSGMVITDDNFTSILAGVEEGRIAYENIRKVIYLLISTGASEVVLVIGSLIAGLPLPLLPVQLLWLNLVTNGIQDKALAFEPGESHILQQPPRPPHERIFNQLMIERVLVGAVVIGLVGLGLFQWLLEAGVSEPAARNSLLLLMVLLENVHIGNCRSETQSLFRLSPLKSPFLLAGAMGAFLLHLLMLYLPFGQTVLGTAPVSWRTWAMVIGLSLTVAAAMELHKLSWNLRHPVPS